MTWLPLRLEPDGRTLYKCDGCGAVALVSRAGQIRHTCPPAGARAARPVPGWPTDPAAQLELVAGWLREWHAKHPDAGDLAAAEVRLGKCLGECKHFTPARCVLAGRGCDKRPTWWRWILAGECERWEARPLLPAGPQSRESGAGSDRPAQGEPGGE